MLLCLGGGKQLFLLDGYAVFMSSRLGAAASDRCRVPARGLRQDRHRIVRRCGLGLMHSGPDSAGVGFFELRDVWRYVVA